MKAIEILTNLKPYLHLLNEIYLRESNDTAFYCKRLKVQYHFITLEVKSKSKQEINPVEQTEIKITFEIKRGIVILCNLYLANSDKNEWIEKRIIDDNTLHTASWKTKPAIDKVDYEEEICRYLEISDRIAEIGNSCSGGDYYPGYYSGISVTGKVIRLSQVNRQNSRSIDHKKDYHLRELDCIIDLDKEYPDKVGMSTTRLGKMRINFSDRSSDNNKSCGEAIASKIKEEKENFEQRIKDK